MPTITPIASPTATLAPTTPSATDARSRAIAKFSAAGGSAPTTGNAQATPVPDPNNISMEDLSAIRAAKPENGQDNTIVDPVVGEPTEVTKPKEDPLSAQYAQLARKEKALRVQAQQIKAREAALAQQEASLRPAPRQDAPSPDAISRDRLMKEPLAVLAELGMSYDQITQAALNAPTPEQQAQQQMFEEMRAEIKALKDAQEGSKKDQVSQTQAAYNAAVNQIRNEAKQAVYASDDFEAIRATNSVEDVVTLITKTYESDGVLLSVEQAAKEIEEYLIEESLKLAKLKKIQSRLQPVAQPDPQKSEQTQQPQTPVKTLTNAVGTQRKLTSRERAILAAKGELKN